MSSDTSALQPFFKFPADLTLEEVTDVIREHNDALGVEAFLRIEKEGYVVFNYVITFDGTFPPIAHDDPVASRKQAILRECRGLIFATSGKLIARRFHKFFNVAQKPETQPHVIDWSQPHIILEKLDGSMITPFRPDGSETIRWGTKMGLTDVAAPVEAFVAENPQYTAFAEYCEKEGVTPIFEWCSRKQRIVIDYPVDRLVLTAVRYNHSGRYLSLDEMKILSDAFTLPLVGCRAGTVTDIEALMAETADLIGEEGYVIRFDNGHMVKLKAREYCLIHGTKDAISREKDFLTAIYGDAIDDVMPFLDAEDRIAVDRFMSDMERAISHTAADIVRKTKEWKTACADSKKTFALTYANHATGFDRTLAFKLWDDESEAVPAIKKIIAGHLGSSTKIEIVRHLFGGLRWDDYRNNAVALDD